MFIEDAIEEFEIELQIRNYSFKTIKGYIFHSKQLSKYLKENLKIVTVEEIKTVHIKKFIQFIQIDHAETYINRLIKCIRAFFRYCMEEEIIKENPMLRVSWLKERKTVINTFTDQEVYRMMKVFKGSDFMNLRNKCIMALLLDCGLRCMELRNLKDKNIIGDSILIEQGKGNKDRFIALSPFTRKIVLKYKRVRNKKFEDRVINDETPLILSTYFLPISESAVERVVSVCCKKAEVRSEVRCSPHTCRHYYAQTQLKNGNDTYSVSRLLGHSNTNITTRYLQSIKDADIIKKSIRTSPLMNMRCR